MASQLSSLILFLLLSLAFQLLTECYEASDEDRKAYIVYMGDLPKDGFSVTSVHNSILQQVIGSDASDSLLHSYKRSFNGFVAKLSKKEAEILKSKDGIVSVFPNEKKQLHTTRSWDFLGFPQQSKRHALESDVIVGVIDTGIWPESASFSDEGFGPPPSKWKGSCQSSSNFTCNNKIIGAKFYKMRRKRDEDALSPRDWDGHGTHTASTAAGGEVKNASLAGLGLGTARGGVPSARIAVYKVCWPDSCEDADILAAFDDAIADGVDVISISLGGYFPSEYFKDPVAIGAFHAMKNGILTSTAGGNSGPNAYSIASVSPWSLSVAASTIDRKFVSNVKLGNGEVYEGNSINTFELEDKMFPLVYGGNAPRDPFTDFDSKFCILNSLNSTLVKGSIVLCDSEKGIEGVLEAGGIGTVIQFDDYDYAVSYISAATLLNWTNGSTLLKYINTTNNPTATILKSIQIESELAPFIVSFSSRGPNQITKDILKPDLAAPGVEILAAWSEDTTVTGQEGDTRVVPYNIISGTSMACPHATAAAAYVKSFHPTWSPSAIKSALMTTATPISAAKNPDAELAYGSGQIDPTKAISPGLVYDANETDYVNFLCGQGYDNKALRLVTGDNSTCTAANNETVWDLNYPSFTLSGLPEESVTRVFHRTVTNVGLPLSIYKAKITAASGVKIQIDPDVLSFKSLLQKQSFTLTVTATFANNSVLSAALVWDDGQYQVRSPIVAHSFTPPWVRHAIILN